MDDDEKAGSRGLAPNTPPGIDTNGEFNSELYRKDLASRWITGVLVSDGKGAIVRKRLTGQADIEGRAALAEMLWHAYPRDDTVQTLAMLIAPDGHHLAFEKFRIVIEGRAGKGAPVNEEKARLVGLYVWDRVKENMKVEAAWAAAQQRFGLSRKQVQNHWKTFNDKWRSHYEALRDAGDE